MRNVERLSSVKSELLDIFMSMEVAEHQQRQKSAALRNLRARRGIELHKEFKRLEQDLADLEERHEIAEGAVAREDDPHGPFPAGSGRIVTLFALLATISYAGRRTWDLPWHAPSLRASSRPWSHRR